jgi:serine/threonine protein kinase
MFIFLDLEYFAAIPSWIIGVEYIAHGADSFVFKGINSQTKESVVIKLAKKEDSEQLCRENFVITNYLQLCSNVPHIIQFKVGKKYAFLIEKPFGTTLQDYINETETNQVIPTLEKWAPQIIGILQKIHKRGIIHSDIKPSNVIITNSGDISLIDFGSSAFKGSLEGRGFEGTRIFASKNAVEEGIPSVDDDFESLCYSFYALEIGFDNWVEVCKSPRPTLTLIRKKSKLLQLLWQLWHPEKHIPKKGHFKVSIIPGAKNKVVK